VRQLGFRRDRSFRVKQVHGDGVEVVALDSDPHRLALTEADALVSATPGVLLGIRTADCVPVLLLHERPPVVAAVHAGWRGIVAGVLQRTVEVIERRFAGAAGRLIAAIGPCVGACCYEVSEEVAARFARMDGVVQSRGAARPHLDLQRAAFGILERSGLLPTRIAGCALCTCCRPDLFYSYRRDGASAGRQLSAIGLLGGRADSAG
jgi:YfiH family protein